MPERTCTIGGCDKPVKYRGWCQMHYSRWRRTGTPEGLFSADPIERFNSRIEKSADPDGCWLWQGHLNHHGYGGFRAGKRVLAHRFAYETFVGPIPNGLQIDHKCRVRACVNPSHLRLATNGENRQNLSGPNPGSASGILNVHKVSKTTWGVQVTYQGVAHHGGRFTDLAEAEAAAIALRLRLFTFNEKDRTRVASVPTDPA